MAIRKLTFFLLTFALVPGLQGQVVNMGKVYISPNATVSIVSDFDNKADAEFYNDGRALFFSNFNNDGLYDFYEDTGENLFVGEDKQSLSGKEMSYFNNVVFDNIAAIFQLSGEMAIAGEATFHNGIVDLRHHGGYMVFDEKATHSHTSDYSFVDGQVDKFGSTSFSFPIGDKEYFRWARISGRTKPVQFKAEYYFENSNFKYPHKERSSEISAIDDHEYWRIKTSDLKAEGRDLTLSYSTSTTPHRFLTAAEKNALVILRWDEDQKVWINEGGEVNEGEQSVTTSISDNGIFTFGATEFELECELEVYNLVDLSGANENTHLRFASECADVKHVKVFNRWGIKVFETDDYGSGGDVFNGYSSGRLTLGNGALPSGTYFYIVEYEYDSDTKVIRKRENGYLHLQSD